MASRQSEAVLPYTAGLTAMHYTDEFVILDEPFTVELLAWAIRKNDPDFLRWLNQLLEGIKADGRYEKIHDKWFESLGWFKFVQACSPAAFEPARIPSPRVSDADLTNRE